MLATVVITNFNYAAFLEEAIESALNQTYEDVEVVVVDDGSTDGSREIIEDYGSRIRPVLGTNRGQTAAMNAGLAAASGSGICFLDADDVLCADALEVAMPLLREPDTLKVHWPLREIDAKGRPTGREWPREPLPEGHLLPALTRGGPTNCVFPPTSGNLFAREFLDEIAPLPELEPELAVGSASADAYLSMTAAADGAVRRVSRTLSFYRCHGDNDFAGRPTAAWVGRQVSITDRHFELLAKRLASRGIAADIADWRGKSWFHRLARVLEHAEATVERGRTWILVDDDLTGLRGDHPDWHVVGLIERDGCYWGPAADAGQAIAELERLREEGAQAVLFTWLSRWWLELFPELLDRLVERYACVAADELVLVFHLGRAPDGQRGGLTPWQSFLHTSSSRVAMP